MRACSETCGIIPVVVVELGVVNAEVLCARCNDAMGTGDVEGLFCVFGAANDHATNDLGPPIDDVLGQRELDARQDVVRSLEVVELHRAHALCNGSVSAVLVGDEVVELGEDGRVVGVGIVRVGRVVHHRLARVRPRDQVVEDSETIAPVRVGNVVSKLTKLGILRANIRIEAGAYSRLLRVIPV